MSRAARRGMPTAAGVPAPSDRRFRRPDVRPGRRRRLGQALLRLVRVLAPVGLGLALVAWLGAAVLESRLLRVDEIRVAGLTRLSAGEVEAMVDGLRGTNILRVDFDHYRQRLLDSPWVADVTLARVLPSTIEIRIVERLPMAIARLGRQLYLVDDAGVIIDAFGPQYEAFDLPIVDGLVRAPETGVALVDAARVRLAARFLAALAAAPALGARVSQVDVTNEHDVAVLLGDDPAWLHLGDDAFVARLGTYLDLAPALRERFPDLDYVDLRFDQRIFVRERGRQAQVVNR